MLSKGDDGGPAFPCQDAIATCAGNDDHSGAEFYMGLSVRDYFASAAMAAWIMMYSGLDMGVPDPENTADRAYKFADAMLAERSK